MKPYLMRILTLSFLAALINACSSTPAPLVQEGRVDRTQPTTKTVESEQVGWETAKVGAELQSPKAVNTPNSETTNSEPENNEIPKGDTKLSVEEQESADKELRTDLPETFDLEKTSPALNGCNPSGDLGDGWWVGMLAGRAPESKDPEDWKHFGLLIDLICYNGKNAKEIISNTNTQLRWILVTDSVRYVCSDNKNPCAPGLFKRPLPPYPPSNVPQGERNWPVIAFRVNNGYIDRVNEIPMPGDDLLVNETRSGTGLSGIPNVAGPNSQPPGTLGSGG